MASATSSQAGRRAIRWGSLGVLLLTALLRAAWLELFPASPIEPVDAEGYHLLAVNVLEGHGFAFGWQAPYCPTAIRTPLYPAFLAAVYKALGADPLRAIRVHILLEVVTAVLVMQLARRLTRLAKGRRATASLLAGLLYAINGLTLRYFSFLLAEMLLLPLLLAWIVMLTAWMRKPTLRTIASAGLLAGLAILVKPNVQYLALAAGAIATISRNVRRRWLQAALYTGMLLLTLSPWVIRNRVVIGRPIISTAFEENLARVAVIAVRAERAGIAAEPWTDTWEHLYRAFLTDTVGDRAWAFLAEFGVGCAERQALEPLVARTARREVAENPAIYLRAHLRGVLQGIADAGHAYWYTLATGQAWETTGVVEDIGERMAWSLRRGAASDALSAFWSERVLHIPLQAAAVWWSLAAVRIAVAVFALRGIWLLRKTPAAALLLAGTVLYHIVLPGPIAYSRFYVPAVPVLCALIAVGATFRRKG